jgi:esterase/lipase superfamily enzyme
MPAAPRPTIATLVDELRVAVRARDRIRAHELAREIQQWLVLEQQEEAGIDAEVRNLLAELDQPVANVPEAEPDFSAIEGPESGRLHYPQLFDPDRGLVGWETPSAPVKQRGDVYPIWFGTNRKPTADSSFTTERSSETTRGRVEVWVPEAHRFGEIGSAFWRKLLRFDLRDDHLRVQKVTKLNRAAFMSEIHQAIQDARDSNETSHALFFLHGFNVTFDEAAIRAAQLHADLKVLGATAFFSWPSRGAIRAYPADEATIEASEPAITDFLVDFANNCGADKLHIIAHSMGNRGLLRAVQRIAANAQTREKVKFSQIVLAAPDVDRDLFLDLAALYQSCSERTTLYASARDLAVHLSWKLHDAPRAGYYRPYTVLPGVDTIAVPDFNVDLLGHGYFAQAEALLHDIYDLMRHGGPPTTRQRVIVATEDGLNFWKLKR